MSEHRREEIYEDLNRDFQSIEKSLNIYRKTELDGLLWDLSARIAALERIPEKPSVNSTDRHPLDWD
jgi:hypothetical protein